MLHAGELGVHPPGALGVAFFMHAGAECFIGRGGSGITGQLKEAGALKLLDNGRLRSISLKGRIFSNLLEAEARDRTPELLFVCCNPDQLASFTSELTRFLENLAGRGHLRSVEDIRKRTPIMLILPNGILYEETVATYEEQIDESRLMRRLPGVTDEMVSALIARVVRGVSLQAGGRRGSGAGAVYLGQPKGKLLFAGGGAGQRGRIEAILTKHDYPYRHARNVPGTRIEFDKAMISIVLNVGGLIHTVKQNGELIDLRMGDLCKDPSKTEFVERVTRAVFDVGLTAGAYPQDASYEQIWAGHRDVILSFAGHVTSSLKSFRDALDSGLDRIKLFPNEEWILTPLIRYAANAGMKEEESLFRTLRHDVQAAMARAISYRDGRSNQRHTGVRRMNLTAQRNISIELFEVNSQTVLLVGTMLDNEHLIKLEIEIDLPNEQITRSKLNMIRVPFPVCREVEAVAERLVGLRIERGVVSEIVRRVGGRVGCSHIKEIATNIVYFAASYLVGRHAGVEPMSLDFTAKPAQERFVLTKELLRGSCLAYCQTTPQALDERIGIKCVGKQHTNPIPLGDYEPSLGSLLRDRAERFADRVFLRWRRGDKPFSLTWREFGSQVHDIARHLIALGVRPGDRIGMISENRPEMFLCELAVTSIGSVTVPIFAGYPARQVSYVLGHAKPKFVIVSNKDQLDKIERDRHPRIERYFSIDHDAQAGAWGAVAFAELMGEGGASNEELQRRMGNVHPDDLCLVMYTSGTTGPPKGVCLSHRNIISQQKAVSLLWDVCERDVVMNFLPWHHSFGGIFERTLTLYHGCELCLDDSRGRDIDRMIDNWKAYDPTLFFSVPRVHDLLVTRCRQDAVVDGIIFGGRLRWAFTAGAPLPATIADAYRQHNIAVLEGWGLTETAPSVTLTTLDQCWKSGYVGFPIPGVAVRIENDREILVKGPNVMSGYLDDEEATAHVLESDGWFHTGDLGEFSKEGLRILGRKDGAFKLTTGEKVHPHRIETILANESAYIAQAVAVGSGKDFVAALVYPNRARVREWAMESGIETEALLDHPAVRELFAEEIARLNSLIDVKYQRVRRAVLMASEPSLDSGELTSSGKLVRQVVMDHEKNRMASLFSTEPAEDVIEVELAHLQRT